MNESWKDDRLYPKFPRVGVHALVIKNKRALLVKRRGEPSKGMWGIPGGGVEIGETVDEAAKRELLEECSIEIEIERFLDYEDYIERDKDGKTRYHFVVLYVLARETGGEVRAQSDAAEAGWFTAGEAAALNLTPSTRKLLNKVGLMLVK
jgi:ADP-ribose pyrophosphatase YjhB (NUDIX family)